MARLLLRNANLIDGLHAPRSATAVLVDGDRIAAVERDAELAHLAAGADVDRVVDCGGRTLMPGLASCHFHSCFDAFEGTRAPALGLEASPAAMTLVAARNVRRALDAGFTSLICSSAPHRIDAALREEIRFGRMRGPRMYAGSHELCTTGDIVDVQSRYWWYGLAQQGTARRADGPEGLRLAVREEIAWGADIVKIAASNGHGVAPAHELTAISPEELQAAARAAHERGKKVRAHAASRTAVLDCARAGFDVIDHADRADARCIDAILEAGSFVVPSLLFSQRFVQVIDAIPEEEVGSLPMGSGLDIETPADTRLRLQGVRADYEYACAQLHEMHRAGVALLVGDDYGTPLLRHGEYALELVFYVKELGLPALDVIRWATLNAARAMDAGDLRGAVAPGLQADLLLVDGDPAADIACLADPERIAGIWLDGACVKDPDAAHAAPHPEGPASGRH